MSSLIYFLNVILFFMSSTCSQVLSQRPCAIKWVTLQKTKKKWVTLQRGILFLRKLFFLMESKHACLLHLTEALSSYVKIVHYTSILDDNLGQRAVMLCSHSIQISEICRELSPNTYSSHSYL